MLNRFDGIYQSFTDTLAAHWKPVLSRLLDQRWNHFVVSGISGHFTDYRRKYQKLMLFSFPVLILSTLLITEIRTSRIQAWYFYSFARDLSFSMEPGPAKESLIAPEGPYDRRLGYTHLPLFIQHLSDRGYRVTAQARASAEMHHLTSYGIYPVYYQKDQAGLTLLDTSGEVIYMDRFPHRVYESYEEIPPILVHTLLFIENQTLLNTDYRFSNPAVEWNRLGKAVLDKTMVVMGSTRSVPGGSTLATQLEKVRHSPNGLTESVTKKGLQMLSATFRSYLDGEETLETRKRIVLSYLNAVPLAAVAGHGEVIGLGDGMWAWYGVEFDEYNRLLTVPLDGLTAEEQEMRTAMFMRALSLFLAQRRPSWYLATQEGRSQLDNLTDFYSKLLLSEGIITPDLHNPSFRVSEHLQRNVRENRNISFIDMKAANTIRTELLRLLRVNSFYDLDTFDLTVQTTFNHKAQEAVSEVLQRLHDPDYLHRSGFEGSRLVTGNPEEINYAVVMYERTPEGNLLRIQTDNLDKPLNINEGTKLELGSTAKLRTLVHYLEIINRLYEIHAGTPPQQLRQMKVPRRDVLTRWTIDYLAGNPETTLRKTLEAALERRYSAGTGEQFFTGGGMHRFNNFDNTYEGRMLTVAEAFNHSVNLPFIRLMRDIVYHYAVHLPGNPTDALDNPDDPQRRVYLSRFADMEGLQFLDQFYLKYSGIHGDSLLHEVLKDRSNSPGRAAWIFRSVRPEASLEEFLTIRGIHTDPESPAARNDAAAFRRANVEQYNWQDLGYLANVHPLELWLAAYLYRNPAAKRTEWTEASKEVRQEVYEWLFRHRSKRLQDNKIWQVIEKDAFSEIHHAWRKTGYPFTSLVPSYATSIGSSADRPGALADLAGIILNDGIRVQSSRIEKLHFAEGTPYETVVERNPAKGIRVLSPEVAAVVRNAMVDVVDTGTARRIAGAMKTSDGEVLAVGAKTGTGNNRIQIFGTRGTLIDSKPLNRTSTLVFFIGDRFFGTVTVYVTGNESSGHAFTSSLPAQLLRHLADELTPLFDSPVALPGDREIISATY
jgi:membrane peptidoglycan carboxypeptidase